MASWLKVAEDLFEVVDRKAKLVADEQTHLVLPASSGRDAQDRSIKSKDKAQRKPSNSQPPKVKAPEFDKSNVEMPPAIVPSDKNDSRPVDKVEEISPDATVGATEDPPLTLKDATTPNDVSTTGSAPVGREDGSNNVMDISEVGPITSSLINDPGAGKFDGSLEILTSAPSIDQVETVPADLPVYEEDKSENTSLSVGDVKSESGSLEVNNVKTNQGNNPDSLPETSPLVKMANDNVNDTAPAGVQDQLNEAQGLLKTAVSTGQSKEARLARVCAGLSSRLQEYKSENAQLEELLVAERELSSSYQACIKQLEKDKSTRRGEAAIVESSMADALAAKNAEIEALSKSVETFKRRASESEEKLLSLQENMDTIMRSRELTETRMMQALKEELASAQRRAEEERSAHNATKMAAVDREVELEHRAVEASNALARTQRAAEESSSRAMDLEHKLALLEVECATLNQELQEMEARARRGQKKSSEESNQVLQIQAWQEEVERARQGQRDAESKLSSLEAEMQKMRVEMAGMRRDAEHYSRHEHMELEKRYRELTDLLYHKQTQLETMASEKAAIEFHLEKEIKRHQEAQVEAERSRSSRRASSTWEEDADLKTLEPLPLHHRHMAAASIQLERAAKFVDSGAVRATRFLWRYPYARVILLFYLVFVHLFLMYLLHRLQEHADSFAAREVAASMGLNNSRLP